MVLPAQTATDTTTLDFARQRLFEPLGIDDVFWPADPAGINHGWGDLQLRPLDMAKLGLLMLRAGRWEDRQLVPVEWVDSMVTTDSPTSADQDYGFGWWLSRGEPALFEAVGRGGQRITVVPERDLIVVITGGGLEPGDIGTFILRSLRSDAPLSADSIGEQRLADLLRLVAEPPPPLPVRQSGSAPRVSGRIYDLEENALGVASFSVAFSDARIAVLRLRLDNGEEVVQPLGLDGRYEYALDAGAASAGRGAWLDDRRFSIELNRLSLINRYLFEVEFDESNVTIEAFEPTELGTTTLRGTARQ